MIGRHTATANTRICLLLIANWLHSKSNFPRLLSRNFRFEWPLARKPSPPARVSTASRAGALGVVRLFLAVSAERCAGLPVPVCRPVTSALCELHHALQKKSVGQHSGCPF